MKRKLIRSFGLALALLTVVCMVSLTPSAAAATVVSGTSGNVKWTLDSEGCLTLTGTGAMSNYTSGNAPWKSYVNQIYTVIIGDGITTVGNYAFYDCAMMISVTLPDGITGIGANAFQNCDRLTSINFPATLKTIGSTAFSYCYNLTDIVFPDGLQSIGDDAFEMCSSLDEVILPDSVTYMGDYCFFQCDDLERVVLSDNITTIYGSTFFDCDALVSLELPANLKSLGDTAINSCDSLLSITLPASVTSLDYAPLSNNVSMTAIYVEEGNTAFKSVDGVLFSADGKKLYCYPSGRAGAYTIPEGTEIVCSSAFSGCSNLTSLTLADSVTTFEDYAISRCTALTSLDLKNVKTFGEHSLEGCTALTKVTFGNNLQSLGYYLFHRATNIAVTVEQIYFTGDAPSIDASAMKSVTATVYYPADNTTWSSVASGNYGGNAITWVAYDPNALTAGGTFGDSDQLSWTLDEEGILTISGSGAMPDFADGAPWNYVSKNIKKAVISEGVTNIGAYCFYDCCNLTEVSIPAGITAIGEGAFYRCGKLTSVSLPESLQSMGGNAFARTGLTEVSIPGSCLEWGSGVFIRCKNLESVVLPDNLLEIPADTFAYCGNLTAVEIPDSVTTIGAAAFYGSGLTEITLPAAVTSCADRALAGCENLLNIYVSEGNTNYCSVNGALYSADMRTLCAFPGGHTGEHKIEDGVVTLAVSAFEGGKLTGVDLPDSVETVSTYAFLYCDSLKSINLTGNATTIGNYAFYGCTNLEEAIMGDHVTSVGSYAFYGCDKLVKVVFGKNVSSIGKRALYFTNHDRTVKQIYFTGNAPAFNSAAFQYIYADIYYPADNSTWTSSVTGSSYGAFSGGIVWRAHTHSSADSVVTAPTCTEAGYTTYVCSGCLTEYVDDEVPALGHAEVIDEAIAPSCTETGLTAGKHCDVCDEVLVAQEEVPATGEHIDEDGDKQCDYGCGTQVGEVLTGSIRARTATLNLLDKVCIIYNCTDDLIATNDEDVAERGVLLFDTYEKAEAKDPSQAYETIVLEYDASTGRYAGQSEGIAARDMDKSQFAVAYLKMVDGTYIFGTKNGVDQIVEYSPLIYCTKNKDQGELGELCRAMMHYGAAAQVAQRGMTEGLMNEGFEAIPYDETVLGQEVFSADTAISNGLKLRSVTMDLQGAISYIVKFSVEDTALNGKELYAEYSLLGETESVALELGSDGRYAATIDGVPAKDLGATLKVKAYWVNESGERMYSGELVYSGYEYVRRALNNANFTEEVKDLAKALAMYISHADAYSN